MQINWTLITWLVIAFFIWSGFARGWWKEAITTIFLAAFIFLLQQPDWAQWLIDRLNDLIETIWNALPDSVTSLIADGLETIFGVSSTGGGAVQFNASDSGTWIVILILAVGVATFLGRISFSSKPTLIGALLGSSIGGLNGFLLLNLVREYLDGRALPGRTTATAQLTSTGGSSFGAAAQTVTIQATNMPDFTILDSVFPWIIIGFGILFVVVVLTTKFVLKTNKEGGRKIDYKVLPPFYKAS